jgi:hypothetical protein
VVKSRGAPVITPPWRDASPARPHCRSNAKKKSSPGFLRGPILTRRTEYIRPCRHLLASKLVRHARSRRVPDHEEPLPHPAIKFSSVADHQRSVLMPPPRGRARPYSCLVLERRNSAIMLPKLYIVPLDELLGIFHRGLIVGAHKSNCSADKTVFVHDVSSILSHFGVTPKSLTTSIRSRLSGSVFSNPDARTRRSQGALRAASHQKR